MLVRRDDLVIGQPAHAWISGQLARAWGNDAFPAPSPREPVCLAAEQHDVGWADADLAPRLGDDGRPLPFTATPRPLHVAIWRDAARRMLAQSRYAALLVSLHGTSLYERIDPDAYPPELAAEIRDYVAGQRELQERLAAGIDGGEVDRNRRLILALDRLSLALCHGTATTLENVPAAPGQATIRAEPVERGEPAASPEATTPAARDDRAVPPKATTAAARDDRAVPPDTPTARFVVSPWPFTAARVVVGCEARHVPGTFSDAAALEAALAQAPWRPLRWELSPG